MIRERIYIIAEAGVNHNGSLNRALEMVRVAAKAGADAVKFQTFKTEKLVTKRAPKAGYQQRTTPCEETQFDMLKRLELSWEDHLELVAACRKNNIDFLSTPFDLTTIDLLEKLNVKRWKIPSGEITNLPYLRRIASFGQDIILSTGMANMSEIQDAVSVFVRAGLSHDKIVVLHCNTEYPTPMKDVNLSAMTTIKDTFPGIGIGYSDHTLGIEIPVAAAAQGASVIEKHFTIDKKLPGPDHAASLSPKELTHMVEAVRNVEIAMGNGIKVPSSSEIKNMEIARKSIVAACRIEKGEKFTENNLTVKRPGTGISPMKWDKIIGKRAKRVFRQDDLIDA